MKRTFTTLTIIAALAANFLVAQDLGKIVIHTANDSYPKFIVSLNGVRLSNDYASTVSFNMLDEYQYRAKILLSGSTTQISYTLQSEPKYLSKYVILKDNFGNYSLMLESKSLMMDDQQTSTTTPTLTPTRTLTAAQANTVVPTSTVVTTATMAPTTTVITAISDADFNDRFNSAKKPAFDRDKIAKIKQLFESEYLNTNQVSTMMKIFSFDDDKMDLAKWCYKRTIDKKNYFKVEDQFTFDRYKKDLGDWVSKQSK